MQIRYTATPRDVGALLRFNLRHSPRTWISLGIVALFPAAANSLLAQVTRGRVTSADVVPGLVFGLLAVPAVLLLARLRTKNDERILSIGPEGVQTSVGKLSGAVSWARIASVGENTDYVFITGKSGNGFAIPSRAFASSAQRTEFVRRIVEYRGANGRGHR
jgi:hypothetical protein